MAAARLLLLTVVTLLLPVSVQSQVTFAGSQIGLASGTWSAPAGMAADGKGNLFIADRGNNRIVELAVSGKAFAAPETIMSNLSGPIGVAADWSGNVFVSDTGNGRILMLPRTGAGFGAPVTVASGLNTPAGLAVDSADNLYIAESASNRVIKLPFASGAYAAPVVVGTGFNNPLGVAVDAARNLFIADTGNNSVVKETYTAGGYPAQQNLWRPWVTPVAISVDRNDSLYIADSQSQKVIEEPWVRGAGRFDNKMILGSGFTSPAGVVADVNGNVYVADAATSQVTKIVTGLIPFGDVAVGASGDTLTYNFNVAAGTTVGSVDIYTQGVKGKDFQDAGATTCIAQTWQTTSVCGVSVAFAPQAPGTRMGAVELFDPLGASLATAFIFGAGLESQVAYIPGTATVIGANLSGPAGVAVDGNGDVFIADAGNNRVVELSWTGSGYATQTVVPVNALSSPMGLVVDGAGNLYVVSNGNDKVVKLPWTQNGFGPQLKAGTGLYGPSSVTVDYAGSVYITNTLNDLVNKDPWTGNGYGKQGKLGNSHRGPVGIAVDGTGNVFFSDPYQNMVAEVQWTGSAYLLEVPLRQIQTNFPTALAADGSGNLYILDTGNNRVLLLPWTGSAFGAQITVASGFNAPTGMAIDGHGMLYVADTGNNQVVRIDLSTPASMSFADTHIGSTSTDSAQIALVGNLGNQALTLSSVTYAADFPEDVGATNPCASNTVLDVNQWCELAVDFTPLAVGSPLNESIAITDDSLGAAGSRQSIPLTGTALSQGTQTINFPAITGLVYGTAPVALGATASSGLPVTYSVVSGPGVLTHQGRMLTVKGAGTIILQAAQTGNSAFGAAAPVQATVQVAPVALTVTPIGATAVYGAIPAAYHYAITGFVNGESAGVALTGSPIVSSAASSNSRVGTYMLTASQGTLAAANYIFAFAPGVLTVNKAVIQVKASTATHTYGAPMSPLVWNLSGFVNGDTAAVVNGSPEITTTANSGSPVGSYQILAAVGTLSAANYSFVAAGGVMTVTPAILTVSATNQSVTYGGGLPALKYAINGFVNGDTAANVVHGAPAISTTATGLAVVGNYPIGLSLGTLAAGNYTFQVTPGVLSVTKAVLQVAPTNVTATYGSKIPRPSYSITGFVNGESASTALTGAPLLSIAASGKPLPGSYPITTSTGSLASKNYSFAFASGIATILKAPLTITPTPLSMTYGGRVPATVYSYGGFVNGDGPSSLAGEPSLTTVASAASPAGTYPIVGSMGTLSSDKYTFNVTSATLTVGKAVLTVSASSASMVYGANMPAFSYAVTGLVNGDSPAVVNGAPALTTNAAASSGAGAYPIAIGAGSLSAANYAFNLVSGTLVVQKAVLLVSAVNQSTTYGAALPKLTYAVSGFVNGDTQAAIAGAAHLLAGSTTRSPVGQYPIQIALGTLAAKNYTFQFAAGQLTVNKAILKVVANNQSVKVGNKLPPLTYATTGLVNGESLAKATAGSPALSTNASTTKAGTYPIDAGQGTLVASNYQLSFANGTLTVMQ